MQNARDRLIPAAVALAVVGIGLLMFALLSDAQSSGLDALEETRDDEVTAVARSQDQSVASSLSSASGLARQPWEIQVGSQGDFEIMDGLLQFLPPDFETGFFVTDPSGIVTQGVLLQDESSIGEPYVRQGLDQLLASPTFGQGLGGILPMGVGITTAQPTTASVFPILDPLAGGVRGAFVFESVVNADSSFNEELAPLQRGETGSYVFFDTNGAVIGSSDTSRIAGTIDDDRLLSDPEGLYRRDGKLFILRDVPAAGWRLVFEQDLDEFQEGLVGPLQNVGRILIAASLVVALVLFFVLLRRLRSAREEQQRLAALAAKQEEFISIVSHELRTPVSGVLGFLQTSIDHWADISDDERLSAVRRAASNARRLQALTRDVLDSESISRGALSYAFSEADLREEVEAAVEAAGDAHPDRTVTTSLPSTPLMAQVDSDRFQQVLTNLIDNAHKSSALTESIEVSVEVAGDVATISVADRGAGLSEDLLDTVFDKFVRGRDSGPTGTGLGLYISRQIVEAHDGSISVTNRDGGGAVFAVEIPLAVKVP